MEMVENGVANMSFALNLYFRLLFCARYDDFNNATKRTEMQENILVAANSSLWSYTSFETPEQQKVSECNDYWAAI